MIIRRKVNRHFTTVPNEPITDEGLSFEALGLLTYLLSRPDNWRVCIEHLKGRGSIGRDKAYRLLVDLMNRGYIIRRQVREAESQQFGAYEYVVYDEPQRALEKKERGSEPLPENPETEPLPEKPLPAEPYPANQDHNKYLQITNSLREHSASVEAGADAPSVNALAWKEAKALIPEPKRRSLIGLWIKRAPSDEGKEKFRAIVRAARKAGTGDPVPYITAAMDREFPPPPDPKKFTLADWVPRIQAAISKKQWSPQFGPRPGKKGCLVPPEMISQLLVSALATGARR